MPNAVLESFEAQRAEQLATMDSILAQVDERDLVDAERGLLEAARDRITELDAQIKPLREFEALRSAHLEGLPPTPAAPRRPVGHDERTPVYASAGAFLVDYLRGAGITDRGRPDQDAATRVGQARAVDNQTTTETPGLLPTPIIGQVVDLIDANRPLVSSLGGAKALAGIPGSSFSRPKITQHVTVGVQASEKTQLSSQKMLVQPVPFNKATYGGTVDISRQDIDWTSPAAWDILVKDLADVYSVQTETAVAAAFKAGATGTTVGLGATTAAPTLAEWAVGLYTAAMHSYNAGKRMPDRIWCSLDVWAALGSTVDTQRVVFPQNTTDEMNAPGTSSLADFHGDVLGLPRIVVPTFAAGTCIVGNSSLFEVYEEVIGLLSVIEPSILGVQVAYGGYLAEGSLAPTSFIPLGGLGVLPTMTEAQADAEAEGKADKAAPKAGR